ncbi:MAG: RNA polymerase sigma factor [Planctomycetota bacterium]
MHGETDNTQPTQIRLLRQVCDPRNDQAWADFHRIYVPLISSFLRRMGLTDADRDDATQEVLMVAHDALRCGKYDPAKGRFRAWLYGVARRKALVAHRNRRRLSRAQSVSSEGGIDLLSDIAGRDERPERRIWDQEWHYAILAEAMRHLRAGLGDNVFEAFLRYGVERRPVDEVAAELGISTSSVYVYKKRALDAIREWVANYDRDEPEDQP